MHPRSRCRAILSAATAVILSGSGSGLGAETAPSTRTGLSGSWALKEQTIHDPAAALGKAEPGGEGGASAGGAGRGHGGSGTIATAMDDPLEALGDARRLVIVVDGRRLEIAYPSGRKRTIVADGEEREQDDGDGPAKVVAKRKSSPELIVITSSWAAGHSLKETWELSAAPRRLVVTGKVSGRHDFSYRRVYEPAPDLPPTPTPPAVEAVAAAEAPPGTASVPLPPPSPGHSTPTG